MALNIGTVFSNSRHIYEFLVCSSCLHSDFCVEQILTNHGIYHNFQRQFFNKSDLCCFVEDICNIHYIIYKENLSATLGTSYFPKNCDLVLYLLLLLNSNLVLNLLLSFTVTYYKMIDWLFTCTVDMVKLPLTWMVVSICRWS